MATGRELVGPPVTITNAADANIRRNAFVGFGSEIVKGVSATDLKKITEANVVAAAPTR